MEVNFKTRLQELRKAKRLTQEELANKINVTKLTISNWENGKHQIKSEKAQEIADVFDVSLQYLLGYDVPKKAIPYETYTPREYNAWEEYNELGLDETELKFEIYEELRNKRNFNSVFLEIISNYSLSNKDDQKAIRQLAKTTAKANSGYSVGYKDNDK
ncbi:hypothetical protein AT575_06035 [Streptococcus penaeicida]|uniref:HTH cro/C1-type domain-containing protein n=1 Tax=Streptococcus penaeicida TaxID=1765960 RepID=A0A2N8LBD4_9STRE|nr:helix-turn-helix domain-containing protein [Streptococcus penaeicida]PND47465.1 hypothetical protein AT575_06035 [Streptococcus penaeicida]